MSVLHSPIFNYTMGTKFETVATETFTTDFYNLKNKKDGARRYGFTAKVVRASNPEGQIAFRSEFQTTLNGYRYQSSKYGDWAATEQAAKDAIVKTVKGALKRYERLATDPRNLIEKRNAS